MALRLAVAYCACVASVIRYGMKTMVVKVPERLALEIEHEARQTGLTKSDVMRRRLERGADPEVKPPSFYDLAKDLIGNLKDETRPTDVSARKKYYLKKWGYGKRKRPDRR